MLKSSSGMACGGAGDVDVGAALLATGGAASGAGAAAVDLVDALAAAAGVDGITNRGTLTPSLGEAGTELEAAVSSVRDGERACEYTEPVAGDDDDGWGGCVACAAGPRPASSARSRSRLRSVSIDARRPTERAARPVTRVAAEGSELETGTAAKVFAIARATEFEEAEDEGVGESDGEAACTGAAKRASA